MCPVRSQSRFETWRAYSHESESESLESDESSSSDVSLESGSESSELELDSSDEATPAVVNTNFHGEKYIALHSESSESGSELSLFGGLK